MKNFGASHPQKLASIELFHPAPGFRDAGNYGRLGALSHVGSHGHSWSSSVNDTNGIYLTFGVASLNLSYAGLRAYGLQLRCLSE